MNKNFESLEAEDLQLVFLNSIFVSYSPHGIMPVDLNFSGLNLPNEQI